MRTNLLAHPERLEQALKSAGRYFCLVIDETDDPAPDRDARNAASKAETGVDRRQTARQSLGRHHH